MGLPYVTEQLLEKKIKEAVDAIPTPEPVSGGTKLYRHEITNVLDENHNLELPTVTIISTISTPVSSRDILETVYENKIIATMYSDGKELIWIGIQQVFGIDARQEEFCFYIDSSFTTTENTVDTVTEL